jgi:hypothetical protein
MIYKQERNSIYCVKIKDAYLAFNSSYFILTSKRHCVPPGKHVYNNHRNKDILKIVISVFFCQYHRLILLPYYPWIVRNIGNVVKGIDNMLQK